MLSTTATAVKSSPILDRKIDETGAGLPASYTRQLHSISKDNAAIIVDYIAAMKNEVNLADNYRRGVIEILTRLSKYNDNKPFKDSTRSNIIAFLETHRKTETQDPMHKWIGTYNLYRAVSEDNYLVLKSLGRAGDSFNDVVTEVLKKVQCDGKDGVVNG